MRLLRDCTDVVKKDARVHVTTKPEDVQRSADELNRWHQKVAIVTFDAYPNNEAEAFVDSLVPTSNNIEHSLGFRSGYSVKMAHRELLEDSTPGCYLVVQNLRKASTGPARATAAASSRAQNYHIALLDGDSEQKVVRGYEVSLENGTYTAKKRTRDDIISTADLWVRCYVLSV